MPGGQRTGAAIIVKWHPPELDRGPGRSAPAEPGDDELVARCATEPETFGLLYDRYSDRIHRYVYSRLRDRSAAEDVTAEAFLKALRSLGTYRRESGEFGAWLYRIAGNTLIDHLRAVRPMLNLDDQSERRDPAPPVEDQAISQIQSESIWRAMGQLTEAQRTAVVLRLEQDLPVSEIARRMHRTEGAVRVLLHRGLTAARQHLVDSGLGGTP